MYCGNFLGVIVARTEDGWMKTAMSMRSCAFPLWEENNGRYGTSIARAGLRGCSGGEGDRSARRAIRSINAAARICWRALT